MSQEMDWDSKLDAYSASLCRLNASAASCWRPKTFTTEWPVYISSMWPLSLPVVAHCRTNCGCERLPIAAVMTTDTGTVINAMSASSGEIHNITTSTPMIVRSDVTSLLI